MGKYYYFLKFIYIMLINNYISYIREYPRDDKESFIKELNEIVRNQIS